MICSELLFFLRFLSIELSIENCSFVPFCRMHCFLSTSIAYSIIFQTVLLEPFIFALCLSICQHVYRIVYRHVFTLCRLSDVKVCLLTFTTCLFCKTIFSPFSLSFFRFMLLLLSISDLPYCLVKNWQINVHQQVFSNTE